ncbi:hypothetical protein [uncultured Microscilla sp.]|uniref:hypothetical protein n=1 Tax=uncultured Microscilla sp. TaxID=432653 RepID=UPI0026073ED8|nr:hypothetical protein [uncultured Microscilla sp.]
MQKVKIYFAVFIACLFTIVACKKKDEVTPTTPGKFGLTQMHTNQRVHKQVVDGVTYVPYQSAKNQRTSEVTNFDLGNLKASKSFYFILSNTGDRAITDVTIESNNPQFEIFPKTIDKLAGASENGIVPLLELGVIHGNRLNGVGFQSLLPMGDNTVEVTIKGKTQGENGEEAVELKAQVKLFAQVMDVEFYKNGEKIDLSTFTRVSGPFAHESGLSSLRLYVANKTDAISVKNVGNVNIQLKYEDSPNTTVINKPLATEQELTLDNFSDLLIFALDGGGAMTPYSTLQLGNDGKAYMAFQLNK